MIPAKYIYETFRAKLAEETRMTMEERDVANWEHYLAKPVVNRVWEFEVKIEEWDEQCHGYIYPCSSTIWKLDVDQAHCQQCVLQLVSDLQDAVNEGERAKIEIARRLGPIAQEER